MITISRNLTLVIAALLALALTGCASQGYEKAEVAGKGLRETRGEVVAAKDKVAAANASIDGLAANPQGDLKPQFEKFSKAVDELNKTAQRTRDRATDMRAKREEYVKKWQSDVDALQSPEMKQRAVARMGEAQASFQKLSDKMAATKEAATPYLADINDLHRYLSSDLTTAGVKSVGDLVSKTRKEGDTLQKALDDVIAELDRVGAEMAPGGK